MIDFVGHRRWFYLFSLVFIVPGVISLLLPGGFNRGIELPELRLGEREVNIRFQLEKQDRETLQQLRDLSIPTVHGTQVPLGAIARFEVARTPGRISRRDGKTSMTVRLLTVDDDVQQVYRAIEEVMADQ